MTNVKPPPQQVGVAGFDAFASKLPDKLAVSKLLNQRSCESDFQAKLGANSRVEALETLIKEFHAQDFSELINKHHEELYKLLSLD